MSAVRAVSAVVGVLVVLTTMRAIVRTVVVPRGLSSRLSLAIERSVHRVFLLLTSRTRSYVARDRMLAGEGPSLLLTLLVTWLSLLIVGYSALLWGVSDVDVGQALRESASSVFTLGFATTEGPAETAVDAMAAACGLVVVALLVAYLPTLYAAFNRREILVTTLEARAGTPAWGPELLARHAAVGIIDNLRELYMQWEHWAADVAESHTNYAVLVSFRSPKPMRSWVVALLAVMDSAALHLALNPSTAPSEARLCLRMSFTCLRDVAKVLGVPYDPDPMPSAGISLTYDEFREGVERMARPGFPMERTVEEAWPHFQGWRVNYEAVAYALADVTDAVPGPWTGPRTRVTERVEVAFVRNRTPDAPDGAATVPPSNSS